MPILKINTNISFALKLLILVSFSVWLNKVNMLDESKLNMLQNAMQRFCESDCREKRMDALREILDLIDFEDSPSSSQCLAEFNRGL